MSGKLKNKEVRDAPVGAPDIAHPRDEQKYERQLAFVYAWFFENIERLAADDVKAAHSRDELQSLFRGLLRQLLRLALDNKDSSAKQWAGELLANIFVSIDKHDGKLSETNASYLREKKKLGKLRKDVLFAKRIGKAVQRELKTAERHRKTLRMRKAGLGKGWKQAAQDQNIPEDYWPAVELSEFSTKAEPEWWGFLWPLIKKHNPALLRKLRSRSSRAERADPKDKKSGTISITPRWASYREEFRNHLRTLARLRSGEVL